MLLSTHGPIDISGVTLKQRSLEPAPSVDLGSANLSLGDALSFAQNPILRDILRRANEDYLYWDKFKYLTLPTGFDHKVAWFLLKLSRALDRRDTRVVDVNGHPFSYSLTPEVLRCLHVVDKRAGGTVTMESGGIPAENQKRFLVNSLMEEAIASSQIEGASTTTRVAKEMLRTGRQPADRPERIDPQQLHHHPEDEGISRRADHPGDDLYAPGIDDGGNSRQRC